MWDWGWGGKGGVRKGRGGGDGRVWASSSNPTTDVQGHMDGDPWGLPERASGLALKSLCKSYECRAELKEIQSPGSGAPCMQSQNASLRKHVQAPGKTNFTQRMTERFVRARAWVSRSADCMLRGHKAPFGTL